MVKKTDKMMNNHIPIHVNAHSSLMMSNHHLNTLPGFTAKPQ